MITLSKKQQEVFDLYKRGENVFLTGAGGTGKTALIKCIYNDALIHNKKIQVCALTGCAAVLLECKAKTIHSWSGIGIGNGTPDQIISKVNKYRYLKQAWKTTNILIIDEVSMMSRKIFDLLNEVGKTIRRNRRLPFGGMQVIFSGDFYQLPPIDESESETSVDFCFESENWFTTFPLTNHVILTEIFRQNEPVYQKILNQVREGRLKMSSFNILQEICSEKELPDNMLFRPTKLFPTRHKVDCINEFEMARLEGDVYTYNVKEHIDIATTPRDVTPQQIEYELDFLKKNLRCDTVLNLKVGAQVMCIANITLSNGDLLCNGARGIVEKINVNGLPVVNYGNYIMQMEYHTWLSETIPTVGIMQIPLILAWAITIHKSQGVTLDAAEIDVGSGIFECGQTYVALSRVKTISGLYLSSFDYTKIKVNSKVQKFYDDLLTTC